MRWPRLNRASSLALVALTAISMLSLGQTRVAVAQTEEYVTVDLVGGTFYRTTHGADSAGTGLRLSQQVDDFATSPFTSSPPRWYGTDSTCYISQGIVAGADVGQFNVCVAFWGATRCYDTDDGSGCDSPLATTDSVDPPFANFATDVSVYGVSDQGSIGDPYFGIGNCLSFALNCQDNDDADVSLNMAYVLRRNFVGVLIDKDLGAWYRFRPVIVAGDGTWFNGTYTPYVCGLANVCNLAGSYTGGNGAGALSLTVTTPGNTTTVTAAMTGGREIRLNSMLMFYRDVAGSQARFFFDNTALTYRVQGHYQSPAVSVPDDITSTKFTIEQASTARMVSTARWLNSVPAVVATYTPDMVSSPVDVTEGSLSTGSYAALRTLAVNVTLDGDRIFTPVLEGVALAYEEGGGGIVTPPPDPGQAFVSIRCEFRWPSNTVSCEADERLQTDIIAVRTWTVDGEIRRRSEEPNGSRLQFDTGVPWWRPDTFRYLVEYEVLLFSGLTVSSEPLLFTADTLWLWILYGLLGLVAMSAAGNRVRTRRPRSMPRSRRSEE